MNISVKNSRPPATYTVVLVLDERELVWGSVLDFAENSADNAGMFLLLLSRAYTASRAFLLLVPP